MRRILPFLPPALFLLLALLSSAGIQGSSAPVTTLEETRLMVVSVSGFSWERIIPLREEGRLPFLEGLFLKNTSFGDIIGETSWSDDAIVTTLFTGLFPWKHGLQSEEGSGDGQSSTPPRPVWERLEMAGQPSLAVGMPGPSRDRGMETRSFDDLVTPDMEKVTGGTRLPGELSSLLRGCLAGDLGILSEAEVYGQGRHRHLFAHLPGLGKWQRRLLKAEDSLTPGDRGDLLDGYYVFLDGLLSRLTGGRGEETIFFLVSERGNILGRPTYREHYPKMKRYPPMGFLYAAGKHIRTGYLPLTVKPVDLVPTLMYLTGNPVPNEVDGRVIFGLLEENYYFNHPLKYR
jgi:hypothetical protein